MYPSYTILSLSKEQCVPLLFRLSADNGPEDRRWAVDLVENLFDLLTGRSAAQQVDRTHPSSSQRLPGKQSVEPDSPATSNPNLAASQ